MTGDAIGRALAALEAHGCRPRRSGAGWVFNCPCHADTNASGTLKSGDKGALVKCQAGCETNAVIGMVGMEWGDLFDERRESARTHAAPPLPKSNGETAGAQPKSTMTEPPRTTPEGAEYVASYRYSADGGAGKLVKARYRRPNGDKTFMWFHGSPDNGLAYGTGGFKPDLYRLDDVKAGIERGAMILLNEGEKAVERALVHDKEDGVDFVPTCGPSGKESFRSDGERLAVQLKRAGAVWAIVDRDEAGAQWAQDVLRSVKPLVGVLRFFEAAVETSKADLYDHMEAGRNLTDLREITARVEIGVDPVPTLSAEALSSQVYPAAAPLIADWTDKDALIVVAPGGTAKTLVLHAIAADLASGMAVLWHWDIERPYTVLFLSEEDPGDLCQERMERIRNSRGRTNANYGGRLIFTPPKYGFWLADPSSYAELEATIAAVRPDFVFMDTIRQIAGIQNTNSDVDVRGFFRAKIDPWRAKYGIVPVFSHHTAKSIHNRQLDLDLVATVAGSAEFVNWPEAVLVVQRSDAHEDRRVCTFVKGRRGRRRTTFEIELQDIAGGLTGMFRSTSGRQPLALKWVRDLDRSEAKAAVTKARKGDSAVEFLRARPGERFTIRQIMLATKVERTTALRRLNDVPDVQREENPADPQGFVYFVESLGDR